MEVLFGLLALTLLLVGLVAAVFVWAVRSGQFDDLVGPAYRVLSDDDEAPPNPSSRADRRGSAGR